jgi:hypothetical protein
MLVPILAVDFSGGMRDFAAHQEEMMPHLPLHSFSLLGRPSRIDELKVLFEQGLSNR